ncbi:MAG: Spore coat protein E [Pelotomaculum sp. PtaU1.Bin035]|nr:MAG: Spore coat protein E [Pelotomaculum sp. PtaU1.Bin035]
MDKAMGAEKKYSGCPKRPYREIITKAICGTARKSLRYTHNIDLPEGVVADQILGCTLTHKRLSEPKMIDTSSNAITIDCEGIYVAQIWYAYNNGKETDVLRCSINFKESFPIEYWDGQNINPLVAKTTLVTPPQVIESAITSDNRIKLEVELDISAELIGESKILVPVYMPDENEE